MFDSLGLLQLLSALDSISFILAPPLSHLTIGLGHSTLQLSLSLLLLLKLLPQKVTVMAGWLHTMSKSILYLPKAKQRSHKFNAFLDLWTLPSLWRNYPYLYFLLILPLQLLNLLSIGLLASGQLGDKSFLLLKLSPKLTLSEEVYRISNTYWICEKMYVQLYSQNGTPRISNDTNAWIK